MDGIQALRLLKEHMTEKREQIEQSLGSGDALDYPGYREMVGNVRGILFCERQILDLIARLDVD